MNDVNYRINEIFPSIQGEGIELGKPVVFVRLAGCNRKCVFCDTDHQKAHLHLTAKEVLKVVKQYNGSHIILTGGEPTLQNLLPLLQESNKQGVKVSLESNGDNEIDERCLPLFETIAFAPKGVETLRMEYHTQEQMNLMSGKVKVIYKLLHPMFSVEDMDEFICKFPDDTKTIFYIMPVNNKTTLDTRANDESHLAMASLTRKNPGKDIRWGTQFHKLLGVQ